MDTVASCHLCANKDLFVEFQKVDGDDQNMGNDSKYGVLGKEKFS